MFVYAVDGFVSYNGIGNFKSQRRQNLVYRIAACLIIEQLVSVTFLYYEEIPLELRWP